MKSTTLLAIFATSSLSAPVLAGGITTNTNQNAAYLRQLSQEAIIDITGLYYNPAGTAFLAPGNHFSLGIQNARQGRNITTTYQLMAYNQQNPSATREYNGKAYAPVLPSIQYSHNWERWSINANFAVPGGGGKCEFDNGLGTFESLYSAQIYSSIISTLTQAIAPAIAPIYGEEKAIEEAQKMAVQDYQGYSLNSYMKGSTYQFGLTLGGTYKILDNLAVFAGLRTTYATNNYTGYVKDVHAYYIHPTAGNVIDQKVDSELSLDADQTGWSFQPIFGIDYKINEHWNVAMKYEFKGRLRLTNKSEMNEYTAQAAASNATLGQFADGSKVAADIPSQFTAGVMFSPIKSLRFMVGYDHYGDKNATQYGNKQDLIDHNTWETSAGTEFDLCKWVTLSASWHYTCYGMSDAYMNDLSFDMSSHNMGVGARVNVTSRFNIDLAYMHTFYDDRTVESSLGGLTKTDLFNRTSRVFGLGFNFSF